DPLEAELPIPEPVGAAPRGGGHDAEQERQENDARAQHPAAAPPPPRPAGHLPEALEAGRPVGADERGSPGRAVVSGHGILMAACVGIAASRQSLHGKITGSTMSVV